jgi:hypothetical protein
MNTSPFYVDVLPTGFVVQDPANGQAVAPVPHFDRSATALFELIWHLRDEAGRQSRQGDDSMSSQTPTVEAVVTPKLLATRRPCARDHRLQSAIENLKSKVSLFP